MTPHEISERTKVWFGDKTREELLVEIDRIITTDKPALANLYEELDRYRVALERIASNKAFGPPGVIDRSFSGLECQARMRVAREALARK